MGNPTIKVEAEPDPIGEDHGFAALDKLRQHVERCYISDKIMEAHMHTTNLRKVGGSVMLAVPPALLDLLRIGAGARVDIDVENLIVAPRTRPSYSLKELLAQCDETAPVDEADRAWLTPALPVTNCCNATRRDLACQPARNGQRLETVPEPIADHG